MLAAVLLPGCSYSYVDAQGTHHVIGLVSLELRAYKDNETIAGAVADIRAIGLSVHSDPESTNVTFGYSRIVSGHLRNNVLVLGDPVAALHVPDSARTVREADDE